MAIQNNIVKVSGGSILISKDGGTSYALVNADVISTVQTSLVNLAAVSFRFNRKETISQHLSSEIHVLYGNVLDDTGAPIGGNPQAVVDALQAIFFLSSGGGGGTIIPLSIVAGAVDWDAKDGNMATLTLTQSITFNKPTNLVPGVYLLLITYSGVDPFTYAITWNPAIQWPNGGVNTPILTNLDTRIDQIAFTVYVDDGDLYGDWNTNYQ